MGCCGSKPSDSYNSATGGKTLAPPANQLNSHQQNTRNQYEMKQMPGTRARTLAEPSNSPQLSQPPDNQDLESIRKQRAEAAEARIKQDVYRGVQNNGGRTTKLAETLAEHKKAPVETTHEFQDTNMRWKMG